MSNTQKFPVVLRMEGLWPHQIARYEMHRKRNWKEKHCDPERKHLNRLLIGGEDWAEHVRAEIREMTLANFVAELSGLERNRKRKEIDKRMIEGPKVPWRPSKHGPMREVILTVHREWFETGGDLSVMVDTEGKERREQAFEGRAVEWLKENFGDDVVHARADLDETTYHIHAVILPRVKEETTHATFRRLQPSIHPLIKDYEAAQDSVGDWFADLGLVRGERRAEAVRKAREANEDLPPIRTHKRTRQWREEQEQRLAEGCKDIETREAAAKVREARQNERDADLEVREMAVAEREDEADAVLTMAEEVAKETFSETPPRGVVEGPRVRKARGLFARAFRALGLKARRAVEEDLAEAADAVRDASGAFEAVWNKFPRSARAPFEAVRQRLAAANGRIDEIFSRKNIPTKQSPTREDPEI